MKSLPSIWCFTAFAPGTSAPSTAVVRKIRLPQTMGDECDRPSIGVFHLMFFVGLHSDGRFFSLEMPEPSGPRHCGQFPAETVRATKLRDPSAREIPTIRVRAIRFTVVFPSLFYYPRRSGRSAAHFADLVVDVAASPNAYRCEIVRTIRRPSEIAGVAIMTSPTGFLASNSYFGPALTTNTSPSSLERYIFPSEATGEAVNAPPVPPRRS